MQPWQRATEEILEGKRQGATALTRGMDTLLRVGVPSTVALQGLSKLNPFIKKFGDIAKKFGYSEDEIVDHMREKTEQQPAQKSLFRRLAGDVDVTKLDEKATKELSFLEKAAAKLESEGKDEKHPAVKKLKKKIAKSLAGMTGMIESEAMGMEPQQEMPLKIGDHFVTRKGEEAVLTKLDNKTFEYKTEKGVRSGPISSLKYEIGKMGQEAKNQGQQARPGQQQQSPALDALSQTIKQAIDYLGKRSG